MSVLDASIAVKWFVDEAGSAQARQLLEAEQGNLYIPDIFVVELSQALVRIANMNKASRDMAHAGIYHLIDLINQGALRLQQMPPGDIAEAAYLAIDLGHPLKDCIYLALAMAQGRPLLTADAKFAVRAREIYPEVQLLEW